MTRNEAIAAADAFWLRCPACGRWGWYVYGDGYACGCRFEICAVCDLVTRVTPPPDHKYFEGIEWCECGDGVAADSLVDGLQSAAIALARRALRGETAEPELADALLLVSRALVEREDGR